MRVTMTIPFHPDDSKYTFAQELVERDFSHRFGGFTEHPAMGGWVLPVDERVVKEPVLVIEGYDTQHPTAEAKADVGNWLYDLSCEILDTLTQEEAVLYTVDNAGFLTWREDL